MRTCMIRPVIQYKYSLLHLLLASALTRTCTLTCMCTHTHITQQILHPFNPVPGLCGQDVGRSKSCRCVHAVARMSETFLAAGTHQLHYGSFLKKMMYCISLLCVWSAICRGLATLARSRKPRKLVYSDPRHTMRHTR